MARDGIAPPASRDVLHDTGTDGGGQTHREPLPDARPPRVRAIGGRRRGGGPGARDSALAVPPELLVARAPLPFESVRPPIGRAAAEVEERGTRGDRSLHE